MRYIQLNTSTKKLFDTKTKKRNLSTEAQITNAKVFLHRSRFRLRPCFTPGHLTNSLQYIAVIVSLRALRKSTRAEIFPSMPQASHHSLYRYFFAASEEQQRKIWERIGEDQQRPGSWTHGSVGKHGKPLSKTGVRACFLEGARKWFPLS